MGMVEALLLLLHNVFVTFAAVVSAGLVHLTTFSSPCRSFLLSGISILFYL